MAKRLERDEEVEHQQEVDAPLSVRKVFFNVNLVHKNIACFLSFEERAKLSCLNKRTYEKFGELDAALVCMRKRSASKTRIGRIACVIEDGVMECIQREWNCWMRENLHSIDPFLHASCEMGHVGAIRLVISHYTAKNYMPMLKSVTGKLVAALARYGHWRLALSIHDNVGDYWKLGPQFRFKQFGLNLLWDIAVRFGAREYEKILNKRINAESLLRNKEAARKDRIRKALRVCMQNGINVQFDYWWNKTRSLRARNRNSAWLKRQARGLYADDAMEHLLLREKENKEALDARTKQEAELAL